MAYLIFGGDMLVTAFMVVALKSYHRRQANVETAATAEAAA